MLPASARTWDDGFALVPKPIAAVGVNNQPLTRLSTHRRVARLLRIGRRVHQRDHPSVQIVLCVGEVDWSCDVTRHVT